MVAPALHRRKAPEPVRVPPPVRIPEPQRVQNPPPVQNIAPASRVGERNLQNGIVKTGLERQLDTPPVGAPTNPVPANITPQAAAETLRNTPTPPLTDPAAARNTAQQRADIADAGLRNATPPNRADFNGLPPRLASMEYRDSLNFHNSNVRELQAVSDAAHAALNAPQPANVLNDSAGRVWGAGQGHAGAQALGQEIQNLNAAYGPQAGGQLIGRLNQDSKDGSFGHNLSNLLTYAGGNEANNLGRVGLPAAQRDAIGTAVGQAYDQMSPADRAGFINGVVEQTRLNGFSEYALGNDTARISDLIARSGNTTLKTDAVNAFTQRLADTEGALFDSNQGVDVKALANGAATIAASGTGPEYAAMFNNIVQSFPEMKDGQFDHLLEDPALKDNLSRAFMNNSEQIVRDMTNVNGDLNSSDGSDGLRQFFEMTMFSGDPGQLREQVMGETVRVISQFGDPAAQPTDGRSKEADLRTAGGLVGLIQGAAVNQKDAIEANQESRQETVEMLTGAAFAFAPGASEVLGKGANNLLRVAYDKAAEETESNASSGLSSLVNKLNDGEALSNIDKTFSEIRDFRYVISNNLASQPNLANNFNQGYVLSGVDELFVNALGK